MITAKEAKELYDQSGAEVQAFLKNKVEPEVIKAAKSGKRSVIIHLGAEPTYVNVQPEPLHVQAMVALRKLGFMPSFCMYGEKYVPRGLADDDGNGPSHRNYGLQVGW